MARDIDRIDRQIIELLAQRAEECLTSGSDPLSHEEKGRLAALVESAGGSLPREGLMRIFTEIASAISPLVRPMRVAYLGPAGTFSSIAVGEIFGGSVETSPLRTIGDVFRDVERGGSRYGVVPVENSTEGAVTPTLDELIATDLIVEQEKYLRITYSLLSLEDSLAAVRKVYSFGQPLGQCRAWLKTHLPAAEICTVDSTARAAECAAGEAGSAAIASELAGDIYSLKALETNIEDSRRNFTRFFVMGRESAPPTGRDKTSVVCALKDRPGALLNLLSPLAELGINMTRIESRPDKNKLWEYNFFIDMAGHQSEEGVRRALEAMKGETIYLKILGSYPSGS